jgi:membrane fusion protein (multidrug efflux system)
VAWAEAFAACACSRAAWARSNVACGVAFVIEQTSPLKLRFSIPERYLGDLKTGQTVTARVDPYPGETFTGRIKTVGGVIDPSTRTFFAEAEFSNADGRLRPGLFARVELGR